MARSPLGAAAAMMALGLFGRERGPEPIRIVYIQDDEPRPTRRAAKPPPVAVMDMADTSVMTRQRRRKAQRKAMKNGAKATA